MDLATALRFNGMPINALFAVTASHQQRLFVAMERDKVKKPNIKRKTCKKWNGRKTETVKKKREKDHI
jgi:hypothetical protein